MNQDEMNQNEMNQEQTEIKKVQLKAVKRDYFLGGMVAGMALSLFLVAISYLGVKLQQTVANLPAKQQTAESDQSQQGGSPVLGEETYAITDTFVEKLSLIEALIDRYYYLDDVDKEAMTTAMLRSMVSALGDPFSEYYTAEEINDVMTGLEGSFFGIGAYISWDPETTQSKISGITEGSGAEDAQVQVDDIIVAVDGEPTTGLTLSQVVSMVRGPEGTTVTITFLRDGEYVDLEIERRKVESETVGGGMLTDDIAYIQIAEFDEITITQFQEALEEAKSYDMKGLVIDLRNNGGGSLNAVVEIARQILPEGLIVYTEDKYGNRREFTCDGSNQLEVPLVVLVNGNSASASEIFAGAVKDYGIGTLVGTTTYGKGIVQQPISLGDGSAVKLTVSTYYTPNGTSIHGIGIEPDEVCEPGEEYDDQLERAIEILTEQIGE